MKLETIARLTRQYHLELQKKIDERTARLGQAKNLNLKILQDLVAIIDELEQAVAGLKAARQAKKILRPDRVVQIKREMFGPVMVGKALPDFQQVLLKFGFVQGSLWAIGIYTEEQLADHKSDE
ncbi:MAG: hypothetical protein WC310_01880 [Patescibacteria group bacterium]